MNLRAMTGREFSADALVEEVSLPVEGALARARELVRNLDRIPEHDKSDLDARLSIIHGHETIVEETTDALGAARRFREWVLERWPREPRSAVA